MKIFLFISCESKKTLKIEIVTVNRGNKILFAINAKKIVKFPIYVTFEIQNT
jgi:hypothetical protein